MLHRVHAVLPLHVKNVQVCDATVVAMEYKSPLHEKLLLHAQLLYHQLANEFAFCVSNIAGMFVMDAAVNP